MAYVTLPKVTPQQKILFERFGLPLIETMEVDHFEREVANYLDAHNVLSLSTCRDNMPRCTTLEYFNNGLTVYLFSEGGGKIANLKANPAVSFTIHDPYDSGTDYFGASGLQVWGRASLFKRKDNPEQAALIQSYYRHAEGLKRQGLYEAIQALNFNVITIKAEKIVYLALRKGFRNFIWKKENGGEDVQ
jgi:general stress protein 26